MAIYISLNFTHESVYAKMPTTVLLKPVLNQFSSSECAARIVNTQTKSKSQCSRSDCKKVLFVPVAQLDRALDS